MLNRVRRQVTARSTFVAAAVASAVVHAQAAVIQFDIPPQSLAESLRTIGSQTNTNILFDPMLIGAHQAAGLRGALTIEQALTAVLAGSGIKHEFLNDKTVVISSSAAAPTPEGDKPEKTESRSSAAQESPSESASTARMWRRLRLTQADPRSSDLSSSKTRGDEVSKGSTIDVEEIIVTGSRLGRSSAEGAQEVRVYTREHIERSGQTTAAQFLNTLPAVSVNTTEGGGSAFGSTTVKLRGLPTGTTLVLLNGRRLQTSGSQYVRNFFDLNTIPLAAVDRIEVLASGASAVYGSDAIAGVVNIVLKKDFDGASLSANFGAADGTKESNASAAWGEQFERGHVSLVASYQQRDLLRGFDRALTASNDYTALGGPNRNQPACTPGNVFFPGGYSFDGGPPVPYAAVPQGLTGTATVQDFAATAGTLNTCALSASGALIPETTRVGLLFEGELELTSSISLLAEALYSRLDQPYVSLDQLLYGTTASQLYTVSATNPYNPFGRTVGITHVFKGVPSSQDNLAHYVRPLVGLRGDIGSRWSWEASLLHVRDRTRASTQNLMANDAALRAALNSSDPALALNPFTSGPAASRERIESLFIDGLARLSSRSTSFNGFIRGPLFELPAGPVELALGAEYTRDNIQAKHIVSANFPPGTLQKYSRRSAAAFTETRVPLLSAPSASAAPERLAATLALRYDEYSDAGGTTNPQYGIEWRPFSSVLVRGTYADAFKAPGLWSLYTAPAPRTQRVIDPRTGANLVVPALDGGNPNLQPESGRSWTAGVVYSSEALRGLQVSATHWDVKHANTIQSLGAQTILDNEALFPSRVVRDASGAITLISALPVNFGGIDVAGIDYQLSYERDTPLGDWTTSISATRTYRYEAQLLPGGVPVDRLSRADSTGAWAPRWKGSAALGWERGAVSLNLTGRYVGTYQDYASTREIGDFWLYDAHARFELGQMFAPSDSVLRGAYFEAGGVNVLDTLPQYSNYRSSQLGYDPTQGDIRGRFLYLAVGLDF